MVSTEKEVGFHTDLFGNEVTDYELIEKYSVCYSGYLFKGDSEGYNEHGYDRWEDAKAIYDAYPDIVSIRDNEYGVTFSYGDWS